MRFAPYTDRTNAELAQALAWAQRVLRIEYWDVGLVFGEEARAEFPAEKEQKSAASCRIYSKDERAKVWVNREQCEVDGWDPVTALFHEVVHIVFWPTTYLETELMTDLMDASINRVEVALFDWWREDMAGGAAKGAVPPDQSMAVPPPAANVGVERWR